ncbi:hypothetical protein GQ457_06G030510 [Hibiscus cannabinus]
MKSSTSATTSKKRMMSHADDDEDDENMEKFFALIKNIREARDRLITNNISASAAPEIVQKDAADDRSETKKRKLEGDKENQEAVALKLNPSFGREDFRDEADNKPTEAPMSFPGTSQSKEELDLNLSL